MDYSKITLGELLSSENKAIRRNAIGILKQLQKNKDKEGCKFCGEPCDSYEEVCYDCQMKNLEDSEV